jgi:dTDP-4-amino-4,6-dideoxygalactose transaminase
MIPITKPLMGEAEANAAGRAILSGWTSQGPEVAAFEQEFAACVGAPHACAVSNCTTALHLALLAVGVGPGDEVVTASHSFVATANAIRHCGAVPVFADIERDGFNLDPCSVMAAITPRTKAILCVHQIGMPCDLRAILGIARTHGIAVVEDAACAIGSEILWQGQWEKIGRPHGDVACFSFHPRKVISTGDGGMLSTSNPAIDAKCRLLRQHAMSLPAADRHASKEVTFEQYPEVGFNYRMTDIQAAVGREQLKRLPEIVGARRRLARAYRGILAGIPGLSLPHEPAWARSNWQSYCVRLPAGLDQRQVMQLMLDDGVATRRGVMCSHREAAYASSTISVGLHRSEEAQDQCVLLPLFPQMTEADQFAVAAALRKACSARTEASAGLAVAAA